MIRFHYCAVILLALTFFKCLILISASLCPHYCTCSITSGLRAASCIGKRLSNIETGVPTNVQVLDLSNNSISSLENKAFKILGLTSLYKLQLKHNHIGSISLRAFEDVKELRLLDLSYNHLYYIHPSTFEYTPRLQSLYLQGNQLKVSFGPILIVPSLKVLDISSCQLDHIRSESFTKLPEIQKLNMSNNQLIRLDTEVLEPLKQLKILDLNRNPWSCDGKAHELEVRLTSLHVEHSPICKEVTQKKEDKFERMILAPTEPNSNNDSDTKATDEDLFKIWYQNDVSNEVNIRQNSNNICTNENISWQNDNVFDIFNKIPSFWSFLIGFEIGAVFGGLCIFILLKMYQYEPSPNPRSLSTIRSLQNLQNRTSFLRTRSNEEESTALWTEMESLSCPDTPPPPYRDVLHGFPRNTQINPI